MTENDEKRAFIRQGFASYPSAIEAVERFETEMWSAMHRAFDERKSWQSFRRARDGDGGLRPPKTGRSSVPTRWLWSYVTSEDQSWLTLGLCWDPPKQQPSGIVVAYAAYNAGNRFINVDPRLSFDPRIKIGSLDKNERRPFIVVDDSFDPDSDFRLLLDAIDNSIPAQVSPNA